MLGGFIEGAAHQAGSMLVMGRPMLTNCAVNVIVVGTGMLIARPGVDGVDEGFRGEGFGSFTEREKGHPVMAAKFHNLAGLLLSDQPEGNGIVLPPGGRPNVLGKQVEDCSCMWLAKGDEMAWPQ